MSEDSGERVRIKIDASLEDLVGEAKKIIREAKTGSRIVNWHYAFSSPRFCEFLLKAHQEKLSLVQTARLVGEVRQKLQSAIINGNKKPGEKYGAFLQRKLHEAQDIEKDTSLGGKTGESLLEAMRSRLVRCALCGGR